MQKELKQLIFNFKQVENQPFPDSQDIMYDIQMNDEGIGFMVVEKRKNTT